MGDRFLIMGIRLVGLFIASLVLISSCGQDKSILNEVIYDGPLLSMDSVETRYSDEGNVRLIIRAAKELSFEDGNKEWPNGLFLEIFDENGVKTTTFRADKAFYFKTEDYYKGEGDVVVKNIETNDELTTEELYWKPRDEEFFTERFVTIREGDGQLHTGEGLIASQDFSTYEITKPSGELEVEEEL